MRRNAHSLSPCVHQCAHHIWSVSTPHPDSATPMQRKRPTKAQETLQSGCPLLAHHAGKHRSLYRRGRTLRLEPSQHTHKPYAGPPTEQPAVGRSTRRWPHHTERPVVAAAVESLRQRRCVPGVVCNAEHLYSPGCLAAWTLNAASQACSCLHVSNSCVIGQFPFDWTHWYSLEAHSSIQSLENTLIETYSDKSDELHILV